MSRQQAKNHPLFSAALEGHTNQIESILASGIGINATDPIKRNSTALHCAAYNGHTDTARVLLELNAATDVRTCNEDVVRHPRTSHDFLHDKTPLQLALIQGHDDTAELLKNVIIKRAIAQANNDTTERSAAHTEAKALIDTEAEVALATKAAIQAEEQAHARAITMRAPVISPLPPIPKEVLDSLDALLTVGLLSPKIHPENGQANDESKPDQAEISRSRRPSST